MDADDGGIRCQNPECCVMMNVSDIPRDYHERISDIFASVGMLKGLPPAAEIGSRAGSEDARSVQSTTIALPQLPESIESTRRASAAESFPLEGAMDEAFEAGDNEGFAHAFGVAVSELTGVLMPLCDVCSRDAVNYAEDRLLRLRAEEEFLSDWKRSRRKRGRSSIGSEIESASGAARDRSPAASASRSREETAAAEVGSSTAEESQGDSRRLEDLPEETLLEMIAAEEQRH